MGASESALSGSLSSSADQITTISKRTETADPVLEKLRSLKITSPILTTPPTEGSLTDILVRKSSTASAQVHTLQVELGELKGRLTEVLSNCDALCKRIAAEGTEPLRSSVKPFAVVTANSTANSSSSDKPTNQSSTSLEDELE